ncbi:MAG: DHA2 family efflux MFS transporter permease subunit [Chloroflexi bacterium]|nr:MAG: DHA2 family efflux MFS transporter permease subunit [Chloroflexota bacterium]
MQVSAQVARQGLSYKWIVAIVVILGAFMSVLDQTVVNIAIPSLQNAFGADIHTVQWVVTAYLLTQGAMTPTAPYLANNFGIKRSYILSLIAFTLGSLLCGLSWSLPLLILFRVLQGLGGAILLPLSFTMIFREFPPEERGLALGTLGVPTLLAPALGPILGGYLVTFVSWRVIFFINIPIGIVAMILATLFLREARAEERSRFDLPGFITAAYGLAALLYAFSESTTSGWGSTKVLGFLLSGALSLIAFIAIEITKANRGVQPLLDLRLFANRSFAAGNIGLVFVIFGLFGSFFLLPIYLQVLRGQSAFQAGLILLPQALAAMVSVIVGGRLVDRIGVRAVVIPGLLLLAFADWQLTFITLNSPFWWLQMLLVLLGLALGLTGQPLVVAALADIREAQQIADASTITTVTRSVGASMGIAILATFVQTQTKVHFTHLAEQVTASSTIGQLLPRLQGLFMLHGADAQSARSAALQLIARFLQRQSYLLAIQEAFLLIIGLVVLAIVATLFVKERRRSAPSSKESPASDAAESAPTEPLLVG